MIKQSFTCTDPREMRVMQSHLLASPDFGSYLLSLRVCEFFTIGPVDLRDKSLPLRRK